LNTNNQNFKDVLARIGLGLIEDLVPNSTKLYPYTRILFGNRILDKQLEEIYRDHNIGFTDATFNHQINLKFPNNVNYHFRLTNGVPTDYIHHYDGIDFFTTTIFQFNMVSAQSTVAGQYNLCGLSAILNIINNASKQYRLTEPEGLDMLVHPEHYDMLCQTQIYFHRFLPDYDVDELRTHKFKLGDMMEIETLFRLILMSGRHINFVIISKEFQSYRGLLFYPDAVGLIVLSVEDRHYYYSDTAYVYPIMKFVINTPLINFMNVDLMVKDITRDKNAECIQKKNYFANRVKFLPVMSRDLMIAFGYTYSYPNYRDKYQLSDLKEIDTYQHHVNLRNTKLKNSKIQDNKAKQKQESKPIKKKTIIENLTSLFISPTTKDPIKSEQQKEKFINSVADNISMNTTTGLLKGEQILDQLNSINNTETNTILENTNTLNEQYELHLNENFHSVKKTIINREWKLPKTAYKDTTVKLTEEQYLQYLPTRRELTNDEIEIYSNFYINSDYYKLKSVVNYNNETGESTKKTIKGGKPFYTNHLEYMTHKYPLLNIQANLNNANPHLELANMREFFEDQNLNKLIDFNDFRAITKNKTITKASILKSIIDVGSSSRFIKHNFGVALCPLTTPEDFERYPRKIKMLESSPKTIYLEQTIQEFLENKYRSIKNLYPHTFDNELRLYYANQAFNFTDSIYYIDNATLLSATKYMPLGIVATGTFHLYIKDGPIQMCNTVFGHVSSAPRKPGEMQMNMIVNGNNEVYTHIKRFPFLAQVDNSIIAFDHTTNNYLQIKVDERCDLGATHYVRFSIYKIPYRLLPKCQSCEIDPVHAQVDIHHDQNGDLCVAQLCLNCISMYTNDNLSSKNQLVLKMSQCPCCATKNVTALSLRISDRALPIYGQAAKEHRDIVYSINNISSTAIKFDKYNKITTLKDENGNDINVFKIKGENSHIFAHYKKAKVFTSSTWTTVNIPMEIEPIIVSTDLVNKAVIQTLNSKTFNPKNIVLEIEKMILLKNSKLPPQQLAVIVRYILSTQVEMLFRHQQIKDSLLMKTLEDLHGEQFSTKNRSFKAWVLNKMGINIHVTAMDDMHINSDATTLFNRLFDATLSPYQGEEKAI